MSSPTFAWPAHVSVHKLSAQDGQRQIAEQVHGLLSLALQQQGRAVLAVSGGQSPIGLFQHLRGFDLPWQQVTVTLVDDRQVAPDHPDSNARLVREHLLQDRAAVARFVPLVESPLPLTVDHWLANAERASELLQDIGAADVAILGMGSDGHFASIFPQARERLQALDLQQSKACLAMHLDPLPAGAAHHRLTQTLAHLARSRAWILPLWSSEKIGVLQEARLHPERGWPVSALLNPSIQTPLSIWMSP